MRFGRNFFPGGRFHPLSVMRITLFSLALLSGVLCLRAESPDLRPEGRKGGDMRQKMKERFLENLPPDIRQRFEAAREQALLDPKIKELHADVEKANRAFFDAMRARMKEIDPGLAEIVRDYAREGKGPKNAPERGGEGRGAGFGNLSDAERQQLMAAREKAKADPAVMAADAMRSEAATPEARQAAADTFRKAMHTALLKVDPTIGPVLEKLGPRAPAAPMPGGDGGLRNP